MLTAPMVDDHRVARAAVGIRYSFRLLLLWFELLHEMRLQLNELALSPVSACNHRSLGSAPAKHLRP